LTPVAAGFSTGLGCDVPCMALSSWHPHRGARGGGHRLPLVPNHGAGRPGRAWHDARRTGNRPPCSSWIPRRP